MTVSFSDPSYQSFIPSSLVCTLVSRLSFSKNDEARARSGAVQIERKHHRIQFHITREFGDEFLLSHSPCLFSLSSRHAVLVPLLLDKYFLPLHSHYFTHFTQNLYSFQYVISMQNALQETQSETTQTLIQTFCQKNTSRLDWAPVKYREAGILLLLVLAIARLGETILWHFVSVGTVRLLSKQVAFWDSHQNFQKKATFGQCFQWHLLVAKMLGETRRGYILQIMSASASIQCTLYPV